jgi:hypothetical protein
VIVVPGLVMLGVTMGLRSDGARRARPPAPSAAGVRRCCSDAWSLVRSASGAPSAGLAAEGLEVGRLRAGHRLVAGGPVEPATACRPTAQCKRIAPRSCFCLVVQPGAGLRYKFRKPVVAGSAPARPAQARATTSAPAASSMAGWRLSGARTGGSGPCKSRAACRWIPVALRSAPLCP